MEPTVNAKNADNQSLSKDWKFVRLLKTAWNANKLTWGIITTILIIFFDQFLKYLAVHKNLPSWKIFSTTFCNPNLSLSLSLNPVLFWSGWILAFLGLTVLLYKTRNFFLTLVLAGALSNLIDRLFFHCVVDYISIFNFPVFNLADFFISFGFLIFILNLNFTKTIER